MPQTAPWQGGTTHPAVTFTQPSQPPPPPGLGMAMQSAPPPMAPRPSLASMQAPPQPLNPMTPEARTKNGMPADSMISEGTKAQQKVPPMLMSDEQTKYVESKPDLHSVFEKHPGDNGSYLKYAAGHAAPAAGSDAVKPHNNYYHPSYSDTKVMSDVNTKDVTSGHAADGFLESLAPYTFRYKDSSNEPTNHPTGGEYLGVMSQNVEKSPTGSTLVKDTPKGKMLEGGALMSGLAAGVGRLHERLKMLEGKK